jgi:hypothetical protein
VADRRVGARANGGRRRPGDGDARGMRSSGARGGARAGAAALEPGRGAAAHGWRRPRAPGGSGAALGARAGAAAPGRRLGQGLGRRLRWASGTAGTALWGGARAGAGLSERRRRRFERRR